MNYRLYACILIALAHPAAAQTEPNYWPTQGWRTSAPEDRGMTSETLAGIRPWVETNSPATKSILIVRHGYLVYEQYFRDDDCNSLAQVYSITKSVTSALVGIAVADGLIPDLDARIAHYYPEYFTPFVRPVKRIITLRHCLTMTSGWQDGLYTQGADWRGAAIRNEVAFRPGMTFQYRNAPVHLLAGVLEKVTGITAEQFARERLFEPMGVVGLAWERDPQGHSIGPAGISLTPRDMAKFGFLYLHEGRWDTRQLVPSGWVRESTTYKVDSGPSSGYGYLWWVPPAGANPGDIHLEYAATGYAGQYIGVFPNVDMVVVMTCAQTGMPAPQEILDRFIFPAITDAPAASQE